MILLVFPNQLFAKHPGLSLSPRRVILVEDSLFFGDDRYPMQFHKQKLWLHRASMKRYASDLHDQGYDVQYADYDANRPSLVERLKETVRSNDCKANTLCYLDPIDFMLEKRLRKVCDELSYKRHVLPNPGFLNSAQENQAYRDGKNRWFMADFYKWQRQRLNVLMDNDQPEGGQWSYDEENRKKVPKKLLSAIPKILTIERDSIDLLAKDHVLQQFAKHPGSLDQLYYPTSHGSARQWLQHFLDQRFGHFGDYEDAIVAGESWLWHSVLTPSLNIGLLTPTDIVDATLTYAADHKVPLNSLEGFLRQVIGWREFMRATYEDLGVSMRTRNHWQHHRPMPSSFYNATTGIEPVDDTIRRILNTGYCHHIERLMVLGGFMFLCEIDPDDVYCWFMEMFVDSYDWVMVPNAYAMSQNADGGTIATKPYFSGSSYIRKMSHYNQDSWCDVWDGLYWRWIWIHARELHKNPRWAMMCSMAKNMETSKRTKHLETAESFLEKLR